MKSKVHFVIEMTPSTGKLLSSFTLDMAFDLEERIKKLERVFSKLTESRFGQKVEID